MSSPDMIYGPWCTLLKSLHCLACPRASADRCFFLSATLEKGPEASCDEIQ